MPPESITAVVPTRNGAASIARTVASILRNNHPDFRVLVVDQSDHEHTAIALRPLLHDPRLSLHRQPGRGVSLARNIGIRLSTTDLVALTDDDCVVPADWLEQVARAMENPRIGLAFGNVLAAPHAAADGFLMAYRLQKARVARGLRDKRLIDGIAGNMALRRTRWRDIGGFDEKLGTGASFRSAEETDFTIRMLAARHAVLEEPALMVVHHGLRTWDDQAATFADYMYGLGAMYAKHSRVQGLAILPAMTALAARWAFGAPAVSVGHMPSRRMRLAAFCRGYLAGLRHPIDDSCRNFATHAALRGSPDRRN